MIITANAGLMIGDATGASLEFLIVDSDHGTHVGRVLLPLNSSMGWFHKAVPLTTEERAIHVLLKWIAEAHKSDGREPKGLYFCREDR